MTNNVSNELMFETLKAMQSQMKHMNEDLVSLQRAVVEGFASMKSHMMTIHQDQFTIEQRMFTLENWMLRIRRDLEITDHAP